MCFLLRLFGGHILIMSASLQLVMKLASVMLYANRIVSMSVGMVYPVFGCKYLKEIR